MNRKMRRELVRAGKKTHKLAPQVCVLWAPDSRCYVEHFSEGQLRLVDQVQLARQFCEQGASAAANLIRELTGIRVQVRPYVAIDHRRSWLADIHAQALQP